MIFDYVVDIFDLIMVVVVSWCLMLKFNTFQSQREEMRCEKQQYVDCYVCDLRPLQETALRALLGTVKFCFTSYMK